MSHHTKDKGDLAVFKIQADAAEQGYMVLLPLTEHSPFDLVLYKNLTFKRVQVKYRTILENGSVTIRLSSVWSDRKGIHSVPMDKNEIDLLAIYCSYSKKCYYIKVEETCEKWLTLRIIPSKNPYVKNSRWAGDYTKIPD